MPEPTVVSADDPDVQPDRSSGAVTREVAYDTGAVRILRNRLHPTEFSGWHTHGDRTVYAYVLEGTVRVVYGPDETTVDAEADDFFVLPAGLVHRNGNPTDEPATLVVAYAGSGPTVVPADGPPAKAPSEQPRVAGLDDCVETAPLANLTRLTPFPDASVQQVRGHADGQIESEWHHHGDNDVFGYVIDGEGYVEWEEGRVLARAGDFFHVPAGLVHRDVNPSDAAQDYVLWLTGSEPRLVQAESPR